VRFATGGRTRPSTEHALGAGRYASPARRSKRIGAAASFTARRRSHRVVASSDEIPGMHPGTHAASIPDLYGMNDPWSHACFRITPRVWLGRAGFEPATLGLKVRPNELQQAAAS